MKLKKISPPICIFIHPIGCHGMHITNGDGIISVYSFAMDRNANAYSELFYHCVQVLNEYTDNISEETFLEQYFQANKVCNFLLNLIIRFPLLGSK